MIKLNNKGFTLIELLAVLAIMVTIMAIAIPSITSSVERNRSKQDKAKQKVIISAAEVYLNDHVNDINLTNCYITISDLKTNGYLTDEEIKDSDGHAMTGIIIKNDSDLKYSNSNESGSKCVSSNQTESPSTDNSQNNTDNSQDNTSSNNTYQTVKFYGTYNYRHKLLKTLYYKYPYFYSDSNGTNKVSNSKLVSIVNEDGASSRYTFRGYATNTGSGSVGCSSKSGSSSRCGNAYLINYYRSYSVSESYIKFESQTQKSMGWINMCEAIESQQSTYYYYTNLKSLDTSATTKESGYTLLLLTECTSRGDYKISYQKYRFLIGSTGELIGSNLGKTLPSELYALYSL